MAPVAVSLSFHSILRDGGALVLVTHVYHQLSSDTMLDSGGTLVQRGTSGSQPPDLKIREYAGFFTYASTRVHRYLVKCSLVLLDSFKYCDLELLLCNS